MVSKNPAADAERILRDFARRAFRRSVTDDDLRPYLARVKAKLGQGYSRNRTAAIVATACRSGCGFTDFSRRPNPRQ